MARSTESKTASTRKTAKVIRNLRGTPVHLRLFGAGGEKPYRIELAPRGRYGDVHSVPANLTDDGTFVAGVDVLFEIITKTEANKISYAGQGFQGGVEPAKLVREEETVIKRVADMDSTGKVQQRELGPTIVRTPGADALAEGNEALPENAFPPAKIERA